MIKFHCASCNQKLSVPDDYAGRRVRCSKCNQPGIVPQADKAATGPANDSTSRSVPNAAVPDSASVQLQFQPMPSIESYGQLQEDPNAEIIRRYRREKESSQDAPRAASSSPSPIFERFGRFSGILNPTVRRVGSFPLAVIASVAMIAIAITIWNFLAVAIGTPLEVFYMVVAVAAGIGLCIISEHRGTMMGVLAVFMAILAIISARIVQTQLFIFPEWERIAAATDIPPEREKLYLLMNQMFNRQSRRAKWQEISEQHSAMIAVAISALIQDKKIDPAAGQKLYFASQSEMDSIDQPYDPNAVNLAFDDPAISQTWTEVAGQLGQWNSPDKQIEAVGRYYFRHLFFMEQCRYRTLLEDYPRALTVAFFVTDGCIFFVLRVLYCLIGLVGAYKTCSESFME